MNDKKVTILVNIRVNDQRRLTHLKDSFFSFDKISDNWLVNVRGKLRTETIKFLQDNLGDKMVPFELLDDKRAGGGWLRNALEMLAQAKYDYVLVWNEDHINIAPQETLVKVIEEMEAKAADYLLYTYLPHWRDRFRAITQPGVIQSYEQIELANVTKQNLSLFFPEKKRLCIISAAAVFKKDFLYKVIKAEKTKLPLFFTNLLYSLMTLLNRLGIKFNQRYGYDFVNKIFFYKLRRFPLETPFELEITQDRTYILPMRVAVPKTELFACIDDDINYPGSQLIKRGLYPLSGITEVSAVTQQTGSDLSKEFLESNDFYTVNKICLAKDQQYSARYYEDEVRIQVPLKETLVLLTGALTVTVGASQKKLAPGQSLSYYTNIRHTIRAESESVFIIIGVSLENKKIKYAVD